MKKTNALIIASAMVLAIFSSASFAGNNPCKDEAMMYLVQKFGAEAQILRFKTFTGSKGGRMLTGWAQTNLCNGSFMFDYGATKALACETPRYGNGPQILNSVWATGECQNLLPETDFPHLYSGE